MEKWTYTGSLLQQSQPCGLLADSYPDSSEGFFKGSFVLVHSRLDGSLACDTSRLAFLVPAPIEVAVVSFEDPVAVPDCLGLLFRPPGTSFRSGAA